MKATWICLAAAAALAATSLYAKAPADAPAGSTGLCKDGTYTDAAKKSGACSGHQGVKTWYGAAKKETKSEKAAATEPKAKAAKETKAKETKAKETKAKETKAKETKAEMAAPRSSAPAAAPAERSAPSPTARSAAAGGGAGKVWLNTDSKVYHCEKDALYGKTKQGEYMTEAQAKAAGGRASRGKECS